MTGLRRVWFLFRRNRLDDDLQAEIAFHIDQKVDELVAGGMAPTEARRRALAHFGNPTRVREDSRQEWGFVTLDLLAQDLRYAFRTVARQPMLVLIAVLSLGSAMAVAAAVFALSDAVLFAKLPVPEPDRLVIMRWVAGRQELYQSLNGWNDLANGEDSSTSFSYEAFEAARDSARGRAELFAFADIWQVSLATGGESRISTAQLVSGNYYAALGIRPAAGRLITPADDRADAPEPVAVISYGLWQRRFGGSTDAVGRVVRVNGVPTTIVGVAPRGFNGTRQVGDTSDVTLPLALCDRIVRAPDADTLKGRDPRYWWLVLMARLAPGVDGASVQPQIQAAVRSSVAAFRPEALKQPFRVEVRPGARGMFEQRAEFVEPIGIMAAIVLVVVLIACANLANLLLARGAARDREVAVRLAIGASRRRVARQFLTESLLLGVAAGAVGVLAASWLGNALLPALGFDSETSGIQLAINARVLAFGFVLTLACTVVFGLIPAFRCTTVLPIRSLKEGAGTFGSRIPRLRLARVVLASQVALSVVVLVAAGLLVNSVRNLERIQPGFDPKGILLFRIDASLLGYSDERIHQLSEELIDRLRAVPGVESATFSQHGLLYGWSSRSTLHLIDGKPPENDIDINRLIVDEHFLSTFRIPLLAGTNFTGAEHKGDVVPVMITRAFAERGFGTLAAIGHTFKMSDRPGAPAYRVIGVTGDVHLVRLNDPPPPTVFFFHRTQVIYGGTFGVRTAGPPEALADPVRATVASVDRDLPLDRMRSQQAEIERSLRQERLFARLSTMLGGLALVLACIGVYGLMAYAVARRTHEIGVRMALGAERRTVLAMVVRDAAGLTVLGLIAGLAAALASSRYLESLLFGLQSTDPAANAAAALLLLAVTLVSAYLPARRAAMVDPLRALKTE